MSTSVLREHLAALSFVGIVSEVTFVAVPQVTVWHKTENHATVCLGQLERISTTSILEIQMIARRQFIKCHLEYSSAISTCH